MRECGCPEWVERCAHWDGQWIVLHRRFDGKGWSVCKGSGLVDSGNDYYHTESVPVETYCTDFDEAADIFRDTEIELLRGVAVG